MRLIIMRHGESTNNVLEDISEELYRVKRESDPYLSDVGEQECKNLGVRLTELGIRIDLMVTSAHRRSIQSLKNIRDSYTYANPECHLMMQIHEHSGIYKDGKMYSGLTTSEMREIFPNLVVPAIGNSGWCQLT